MMELEKLFEGVELSADVKAVLSEKFQGAVSAEVEGLKNKNTELLGKLGETKTAAQKLAEEKALAEEDKQKALGNYEAAEKLANERIERERKQHEETSKALESQLRELYVTNANKSLAAELANTPEDISILEMVLQKHISMQKDESGKFQTTYGESGSREKLVEQLKADKSMSRFIKGTGATGFNAQGAQGQGKANPNGKTYAQMTAAEKAAYLDSK